MYNRKNIPKRKRSKQKGMIMSRKIIGMILAGIVSVLLVTGCSSQSEDQNVSSTDTTQEAAQEAEPEEIPSILPADARIGIAYTEDDSEFTSFFIAKVKGNLISAGIPEDNIEKEGGSAEELADNAAGLIGEGCSVLMVGNADESNAHGITDAAVKAGIPVLYFGSSPGENEISRWTENGWRAVYVGSTCAQSAQKRADLISSLDMEKIDLNKDDEIGIAVLYTGENTAGDKVNEDTMRLLEEQEVPIYDLTSDDEEEAYMGTDRDSSAEQVISWMSDYGENLEVILCANDMQALGAWDAVNEEKRKVGHDVLIMGFDAVMDSLAEVAAGNIRSTFFNDFMEQSQNASTAVLAFLKGNGAGSQASMMSEYVNVTVDNAQEILDIAGKIQENDPDSADYEEETDTEENEAEE